MNKKDMYIFIVPKGQGKNIVFSQMIPMVEQLNQMNFGVKIAVHQSDKEKYNEIDNIVVYSKLKDITELNGIKSIYIRSVYDFIKLYLLKKIYKKNYSLLFDFRGTIAEESYNRNNSKFRYFLLKKLEKFIFKKADNIHSVSQQFKKYLITNYGPREITVIPCCIDKNYLKKYEKKENIKFVYVGGMSKWQKFDVILDVYKNISKEINGTSLTVITLNKEEAKNFIKSKEIKGVEVKSMSHEEVIKDLKNYNFGFLLRENILLNNVASPIKFIEYISQGVIPIVSKGIGDYSALIEKHNLGIVIDIEEGLLNINKIKSIIDDDEVHKRLYKVSEDYLWKNNIDINFFKDIEEGR